MTPKTSEKHQERAEKYVEVGRRHAGLLKAVKHSHETFQEDDRRSSFD